MIRYTKDTDFIATLILDMEGRQRNLLNHEIVKAFVPVLEHLKKEKNKGQLRGVIITSAKKNFLVGGNLKYLSQTENPQDIFDYVEKMKAFFRELERPGVPVVAAINGNAIGTGFELALACHHRIALNREDIRIGLPEAKFGAMPGNGGTIRLLWLMGMERAFHLLAEGKECTPGEAKIAGAGGQLGDRPTRPAPTSQEVVVANRGSKAALGPAWGKTPRQYPSSYQIGCLCCRKMETSLPCPTGHPQYIE